MMNSKSIIDLMIKNEEAFSRLYHKFAAIYPDSQFWIKLSKEETAHAQWLRALSQSCDTRVLEVSPLTLSQIKNMLKTVEEEINSKEDLSLEEALKKTIHFENSFIEHSYFDIFSNSSPSAHRVIGNLKDETLHHIERVEEYLEGQKN
ncbi:MAG: hypothetical protein M1324_00275 [Patescibacteria group bacterium]|nr:hypothetical protein [Patescibacteria group bacterium]